MVIVSLISFWFAGAGRGHHHKRLVKIAACRTHRQRSKMCWDYSRHNSTTPKISTKWISTFNYCSLGTALTWSTQPLAVPHGSAQDTAICAAPSATCRRKGDCATNFHITFDWWECRWGVQAAYHLLCSPFISVNERRHAGCKHL